MSAGGQSSGDAGQFRNAANQDLGPDDQSVSRENQATLDQVLKETLDALAHEKITSEEIDALRAVAKKYKNQPITIDPVTTELVKAILQKRFDLTSLSADDYQSVSHEIATALFDGPTSHQRLENFWNQMQESVQ